MRARSASMRSVRIVRGSRLGPHRAAADWSDHRPYQPPSRCLPLLPQACGRPGAAAGLGLGTPPFAPGVSALILHLHIPQAVSFERQARLMAEVFGLTITEGAI